MSAPTAAMVFAAGFGTRMRSLTDTRPKPLIEVAGKSLIDRTLDLIAPMALQRTVVNLHYKGEMLAHHLEGRQVELSWERPDILDTGGGLKAALPLLGSGAVFTSNSDAIWKGPNPLALLRSAWDPARMDALLAVVPMSRALARTGGDFALDEQGRISRGGEMIYAGVQILSTDPVARVHDRVFSLNRVWDEIAEQGRLFGFSYPGRWCDVGHPKGIAIAEAMLAGADV